VDDRDLGSLKERIDYYIYNLTSYQAVYGVLGGAAHLPLLDICELDNYPQRGGLGEPF